MLVVTLARVMARRRLSLWLVITENGEVDVDRLRTETRNEHEATEALVPLMHSELTREQYAGTLRRMYAVVHGWELWAADHAPVQFRELVKERRRSYLIEEDLAFLHAETADRAADVIQAGLTARFLRNGAAESVSAPDFLGAMYVMEGSTLGGQYIARYVEEKFALVEGKGNAYFRGYAERTGSMWLAFKQLLIALPDEHADQVIAAARFMFRAFGEAMLAS